MGWFFYFMFGLLFQYSVYGEPTSVLNVWFILHVALWWLFGIILLIQTLFWPTVAVILIICTYVFLNKKGYI